jgi:hypothetical protein
MLEGYVKKSVVVVEYGGAMQAKNWIASFA